MSSSSTDILGMGPDRMIRLSIGSDWFRGRPVVSRIQKYRNNFRVGTDYYFSFSYIRPNSSVLRHFSKPIHHSLNQGWATTFGSRPINFYEELIPNKNIVIDIKRRDIKPSNVRKCFYNTLHEPDPIRAGYEADPNFWFRFRTKLTRFFKSPNWPWPGTEKYCPDLCLLVR